MSKYYLTTTLPYVNSDPHLGFAMEIVQADILTRYHELIGDEVFLNTGTDEHGQKIYQKALENDQDPQTYTDEYATKFQELMTSLNITDHTFTRTTNPHHKKAAQDFWALVDQHGYIYKKPYSIKYCVGCELEKTDSELTDNRCPIHPNLEIELREEENYFFKFSSFGDKLLDLYTKYPDFVTPDYRLKEITEFINSGLNDFSISRLKEKMPWGVPVPGDEDHVMYVWFDALVNYISCLGWPDNNDKFENYWGTTEAPNAIQIAGKDNLRQQSAMWQAMLLAADLPTSRQIIIHGFITSDGQKMSKSLGNVINPFELINKYGTDAVRFFIAHDLNPFEDSDVTPERIHNSFNSNLANGLGNLVARITKLSENLELTAPEYTLKFDPTIVDKLNEYKFNEAIDIIWQHISVIDRQINDQKPWGLSPEKASKVLLDLISGVRNIAYNLQPFMPSTAEKILNQFSGPIKSGPALFPRL